MMPNERDRWLMGIALSATDAAEDVPLSDADLELLAKLADARVTSDEAAAAHALLTRNCRAVAVMRNLAGLDQAMGSAAESSIEASLEAFEVAIGAQTGEVPAILQRGRPVRLFVPILWLAAAGLAAFAVMPLLTRIPNMGTQDGVAAVLSGIADIDALVAAYHGAGGLPLAIAPRSADVSGANANRILQLLREGFRDGRRQAEERLGARTAVSPRLHCADVEERECQQRIADAQVLGAWAVLALVSCEAGIAPPNPSMTTEAHGRWMMISGAERLLPPKPPSDERRSACAYAQSLIESFP